MSADDTVPTRKNFERASTAIHRPSGSRLARRAGSTSARATKRRMRSRARRASACQQRGEHGRYTRWPAARRRRPQGQRAEYAQRGGDEEQALGEERQLVLDEALAEHTWLRSIAARPRSSATSPAPRSRPPAACRRAGRRAREEDEEHHREDAQPGRSRSRQHPQAHQQGTVAVSTGPIAMPGAPPRAPRTPTRMMRATHSGPPRRASPEVGILRRGPQKICLATRRT